MKSSTSVAIIVLLCYLAKSVEPANTIGDLVTQLASIIAGAAPFFTQYAGQLNVPVLSSTADYTSFNGMQTQMNLFLNNTQQLTDFLVWIIQPGNAQTTAEQQFASAVTAFANALPQINQFLNITLAALP